MEIKNLNIMVDGTLPQKPIEVIILEGAAPQPLVTREPVKNYIRDASLSAAVDFRRHFKDDQYRSPMATYSDDPDKISISLVMDPESPLSPEILSILKKSKELEAFKFNSDSNTFNNALFCKLILQNAHCFKSIEDARNLKKKLESFSASFETLVENIDDKKGNTTSQVKTILNREKAGIPDEIDFNMPFFQGGPNIAFTASVEIEVGGNGAKPEARFGFFSLELSQLLRDSAKNMVNDVINQLSNLGVTCIRII